jgi:ABC-type transport system involved in cytochrome c biogenesis permease subunit
MNAFKGFIVVIFLILSVLSFITMCSGSSQPGGSDYDAFVFIVGFVCFVIAGLTAKSIKLKPPENLNKDNKPII